MRYLEIRRNLEHELMWLREECGRVQMNLIIEQEKYKTEIKILKEILTTERKFNLQILEMKAFCFGHQAEAQEDFEKREKKKNILYCTQEKSNLLKIFSNLFNVFCFFNQISLYIHINRH